MMPSQCPRITPVEQTGQHIEVRFEAEGRSWARAYMSGGNIPYVEPLVGNGGLSPDEAVILSIALQMARDWTVEQMARIAKGEAVKEVGS